MLLSRRQTLLASLLIVPALVATVQAKPADKKGQPAVSAAAPAPATAAPAATPAAPAAPAGANALTLVAVQKGALSCASRIEQISNYLGFSGQAGAMLMPPPAPADQRLLPVAIGLPTATGSAYVSATFAPHQANGCGASYDAVVYWAQACDAVAGQFASFKKVGALGRDIAVLDGGPQTKVFLMPAGTGCISIKKEVVL